MTATNSGTPTVHPSAAIYTSFTLHFYDLVVHLSNSFAWCCSTQNVLLPLFRKHIGAQAHLDIGVGSGYYLIASMSQLAEVEKLTLVDLSHDALQFAERRLKRAGHRRAIVTLEHDTFRPFPLSMHAQYDSVSMFYLFHCLPGKFPEKADQVLTQTKTTVKPDGVVYGATILGQTHNWIGGHLMNLYNRKGVFSNYNDTKDGLQEALTRHFADVEVEVVGRVALFVARKPIWER
ncbi:hypothetical protein EUX98_g7816 [Antrodiella citrinella]|uniref:Methyltransferase type 12 domain-containing protein n=1 Tax=Antrodiella citrinella TaxID=2447956 RepID=A0A4S4MKW8_9APHY|nr:hypothetical protein EUX98_g7816 [Antrodiella citrinella]